MKKVLLKKNEREIQLQKRELDHNLQTAQSYLDWYHAIEFCKKLTGIEEIKKFLDSPQAYYENEVRTHLAELTGLKTLPNNIDNLVSMYEIPECHAYSVSDKFGFEFLQVDSEGKLFYDTQIFEKIESDKTLYATPKEAQALAELERTYANLMELRKLTHDEPGIYWQMFEKAVNDLLSPFFYHKKWTEPDEGVLIRWRPEILDTLSKLDFGQKK